MWRRLVPVLALMTVALVPAACGSDETAAPGDPVITPDPVLTPDPVPVVPEATPEPQVTPTATVADATPVVTPAECVRRIPLRTRLGQLLMPMVVPADYGALGPVAETHAVGAVALLGAPTADELEVLAAARARSGVLPLLVASDEEGGTVQRLVNVFGPLPTAEALAASLSVGEVEEIFARYGEQLASVGVGMALAPVLDVGGGPGIASRSFSSDPEVVRDYAAAVVAGYRSAGVVPVLKHFPGHGAASADTHYSPATTAPLGELLGRDLVPFAALLVPDGGVGPDVAVMVGHLVVPELTGGLPATLSPAAVDGLLRTDLGFDGLVVTDALNMVAVSRLWTTPVAVELSLVAGADLAIIDDLTVAAAVVDHLEGAVGAGSLDEARVDLSVQRVFAAKGVDPCTVADGL